MQSIWLRLAAWTLLAVCSLRGEESEKTHTCEELGLRPKIVVSFQIAQDSRGFGVAVEFENTTAKAIPGWRHTNSPLGLISQRLERITDGKTTLVEEASFNPVVIPLAGEQLPVNRSEINTLAPRRKAACGMAISVANSIPKSELERDFDKQGFRTPFEITVDGEYQVNFVQKNSGRRIGTIQFTVLQAGSTPIIDVRSIDIQSKSK